jgi:integrase
MWKSGDYHVGRITLDGRRWTVKAKTKEEVAAKLLQLRQQAATGSLPETQRKVTVGEWLDEWLTGLFVEPRTLRGYSEHVRAHLKPALGHLPLRSPTTQQIRAFCQQKMAPKPAGGGLHQTTVHNIGMTLRIALGVAAEVGLLQKNPAATRKTIPRAASREMQAWSAEECQRFLQAARADRHEALLHFALATGARQGEIIALRWADVDLRAGTASIKAAISGERRKGPKTHGGERMLHLPPHVVVLLKQLRDRQRVVDLAGDDSVFPGETGGLLSGWNLVMRHMRPIMLKAKVPAIRFHDLRHTFATLMLRNGVPVKDVAYMLGHSDAATTIRFYAHAIPSTHRAHAAVMGRLLTGKSTSRSGDDDLLGGRDLTDSVHKETIDHRSGITQIARVGN